MSNSSMSDKENDVGSTSSSFQNVTLSQSETTIRDLRFKQFALDELADKKEKLTLVEALEVAEGFSDYDEIRKVSEENPQGIVLDCDDAVKRMEIIVRSVCGDDVSDVAFDIDEFCNYLILENNCSIHGDLTSDEWIRLGTEIRTDFEMKDEDNVGFDLLLRTFESVENPENTFASVDITQMSQLAKKQSKTLDQTITQMSGYDEERRQAELTTIKRERAYRSDDREGEEQHIQEDNEAESNRDEREQKRLLELLLRHWRAINGHEPFFYWECVISDSFSETMENIFYLSFLLKLGVIVAWESADYNAVVMVPDYEAIKHSKFGSESKEKKTKRFRARYEVDKILLKTTKAFEQHYNSHYAEMKKKHERSKDVGGSRELSRQGSVSLSVEEWEDWFAFLSTPERNLDGPWQKFFPTRSESTS